MQDNLKPPKQKRLRIIASPIVPMRLPYQISQITLQNFINEHHEEFKSVIYLGWVKRKIEGKRSLRFVIATAETSREARMKFRKSEQYGIDVWDLMQS